MDLDPPQIHYLRERVKAGATLSTAEIHALMEHALDILKYVECITDERRAELVHRVGQPIDLEEIREAVKLRLQSS